MADPKYAGLPGIALDQPDMFETSGGGEEEVEEESSSGELEPPAQLHLSSLRSATGVSGVMTLDSGERKAILNINVSAGWETWRWGPGGRRRGWCRGS